MVDGDLSNLTRSDGWDDWRRREASLLTDLMRRRLDYLQNPADCASAKKIACDLTRVRTTNWGMMKWGDEGRER